MTQTHAWGQKSKKLIGKAPYGHWMTSTFPAGLAQDTILAPKLLPCPMAGVIFRQGLEDCLIPEMKPGSIVVIDNLSADKVAGIRRCLADPEDRRLPYLP